MLIFPIGFLFFKVIWLQSLSLPFFLKQKLKSKRELQFEKNIKTFSKIFLLLISFFYSNFLFFCFLKKTGATPLYIAAQNDQDQVIQILLEKGGANVDLARLVYFYFSLLYFFFILLFFFFECKKDRTTPLYIAPQNGYEQIVQILLDKEGANVDLTDGFFFSFFLFFFFFFLFSFSFSFSYSSFFFLFFFFFFFFPDLSLISKKTGGI